MVRLSTKRIRFGEYEEFQTLPATATILTKVDEEWVV